VIQSQLANKIGKHVFTNFSDGLYNQFSQHYEQLVIIRDELLRKIKIQQSSLYQIQQSISQHSETSLQAELDSAITMQKNLMMSIQSLELEIRQIDQTIVDREHQLQQEITDLSILCKERREQLSRYDLALQEERRHDQEHLEG
jgi:hypothetical protein